MTSASYEFPDETAVLDACDKLVDFHAWDGTKIDAHGWLGNFGGEDRPLALVLLSRFTFFADHLVDQLFRSAFQNLSNMITSRWESYGAMHARWRRFCDTAVITLVQGERPNPSDSGWLFARKARQALGIPEERLLEPSRAVRLLDAGFRGPVVFVDDFVGSGEQFLKTWKRRYSLQDGGRRTSFRSIARAADTRFYYCNAMTTEYGRDRLKREAPEVQLTTGNIIPRTHSLVAADSALWPTAIRSSGIRFVERVSRELGYNDDDGGEGDWRGFHQLGLGIAFSHSVGWTPLVRRS